MNCYEGKNRLEINNVEYSWNMNTFFSICTSINIELITLGPHFHLLLWWSKAVLLDSIIGFTSGNYVQERFARPWRGTNASLALAAPTLAFLLYIFSSILNSFFLCSIPMHQFDARIFLDHLYLMFSFCGRISAYGCCSFILVRWGFISLLVMTFSAIWWKNSQHAMLFLPSVPFEVCSFQLPLFLVHINNDWYIQIYCNLH